MIFAMEKTFFQEWLARRIKTEASISEEALSRIMPAESEQGSLYQVIDGDARIPISGILGNRRSFFDILFGLAPARTYDEIIEAVQQADQDSAVQRIVLDVNSPGGWVDGLDDAAQAIAAAGKPTFALVRDMAASAAYWLASQADRIEVTSPAVRVGSIGILATILDDKEMLKNMGLEEIVVISTDSPRKYVDPVTEAGQAEIREVLDGLLRVFLERVATGRKTSLSTVKSTFGQGALVMARWAKISGMIDEISEGVSLAGSAAGPGHADLTAKEIAAAEKAGLSVEDLKKYGAGQVPSNTKRDNFSATEQAIAEKAGLSAEDLRKYAPKGVKE